MQGFRQWVGKWQSQIEIVFGVIIGLVVVVVAGMLITKGIWALRNSKGGEAIKHFAFAGLAVLAGLIGFGGVRSIIEKIAPDDSLIPKG